MTCNWTTPCFPRWPMSQQRRIWRPYLLSSSHHRDFFERLISEVMPTPLTPEHENFLRAMGIIGDTNMAYRRIASAQEYLISGRPIQMPVEWGYRHLPAFGVSPSEALLNALISHMREAHGLAEHDDIVLLDSMAGGGSIPLEGVRYGLKVYANELNAVASLVLKATIEYPARYGRRLLDKLTQLSEEIADQIGRRLSPCFYHQSPAEWWPECEMEARQKFYARTIVKREPAGNERIQAMLWCRTGSLFQMRPEHSTLHQLPARLEKREARGEHRRVSCRASAQ